MDDSRFDQFLKDHSRATVEVPASFQREVWQRVGRQRGLARWREAFAALLLRPVGSALCVALTILAGIWLGLGNPGGAQPKTAYIQSITPAWHLHHR